MSTVSKSTATNVEKFPVAEDRSSDIDGYNVSFVTILETHSLAQMLAPLPGGHCTCPHWGYLLSGKMTVHYADHDDTIVAGDAFIMTPGHVPEAEAGSEFVIFSPADQMAATNEAVRRAMQANAPA